MTKAQPFMTVQIELTRSDLFNPADAVVDNLFDEFSNEVFDMLGLGYKEFRDELIDFAGFQKMVRFGVEENGRDAVDCPYDYLDFDVVYDTKEWKTLFNTCEYLQTILNDIEHEERRGNVCADAIETLKRAGFKIVKA